MIDRRDFCKKGLLILGGLTLPLSAFELFDPRKLMAEKPDDRKVRWVFLVDTEKCVGCGFCVKACKMENETPYDANASRTWIERHVITKDGASHVDSPDAGQYG